MRYIMILSLCLTASQGYAACEAIGEAPSLKKYFRDIELKATLEAGSFTHEGTTWEVDSLYLHDRYIYNELYMGKPIVGIEPISKGVATNMISIYSGAAIQPYHPEARGSSAFLNHDDTTVYYYAGALKPVADMHGIPRSALYVVFHRKPEPIQ